MKSLDIYKLLPKKNCGECGHSTCLAFAMELAQLKEDPVKCPYLDDNAKSILLESSTTPVKEITIKDYKVGGETVLYRHEKKFYNKCLFLFQFSDDWNEELISQKIEFFKSLTSERVGDVFKPEGILINSTDKDKTFVLINKLKSLEETFFVFLGGFANACCAEEFDVFFFTDGDLSAQVEFAKSKNKVVVLSDSSVENLKSKVSAVGDINSIILNIHASGKQQLDSLIDLRTRAIVEKEKSLGFPVLSFPSDLVESSLHVMKYSSLVVLPEELDAHDWFSLFTLRQSIYADPQKPLQVDSGLYPLNNADNSSPLLVTCNLSLTFFIVKGDIEASKLPCNLLVVDTEGLSVLTAWAAGKFDADRIAKTMKTFDVENQLSTRKIIIPGGLAPIKGDLEDLSKYEVAVGPSDSAQIGAFLRDQ